MREIKFRAWRKQENKMIHWGHIAVAWTAGALRDDPFTIVMQYTGLKDRNSVEIFEGDILNDSEYAQRFEVIWRNGMFSLKILNDNNFHRWIRDNEKLEIIGNIYENPELIKNYPEK